MGLRSNIVQVAVEKETTPGTAIAVDAADVLVEPLDGIGISFDTTTVDPGTVKATSSPSPLTIGRQIATIALPYRLLGPGDLTTVPAVSDLFEAAMLVRSAKKKMTVSAVSGDLLAGETITGGTSSATGLLVRRTASGGNRVDFIETSGTFQSGETITGGTSGETATTSEVPQDAGHVFRPADSSFAGSDSKHHVTAEYRNDGIYWRLRGALADLQIEMTACEFARVTQNVIGPVAATGDAAMLSVSAYPESSSAAPKFHAAAMLLGTYSPEGIASCRFNFPTNPSVVPDANAGADNCVKYMQYDRQPPTIEIEPQLVLAATFDYFATLAAGGTFYFEVTHGSGTGRTWKIVVPAAQFESLGWTSGEARSARVPATLRCTGNNNDEVFILVD